MDKQYGKGAETLFKSASQHFYGFHWSPARKLCSKKYLLLTSKILGLLVKTLAAAEKYLVLHRDNLTILIQMQLSEKQKTFSEFFAAILKSRLNFDHFEKKGDPQSFSISQTTDSENVVRKMSSKSSFRGPFKKQHGKLPPPLFKSASYHLY